MKPWVRVALLLFCVGWGANHFVALLLVYKARLALDSAAPAALLGMYALGLVPGLLLSGPLSDRYGRRALVFPATALTLAASALLGAGGGSFDLLLGGRLLYGIGAGAAMSPGAVWLLELSTQAAPGAGARRATLALSAGFGFGPLLSGLLAQYAPHPTVLPYVAHLLVSAIAFGLALGAPAPARAQRRRAVRCCASASTEATAVRSCTAWSGWRLSCSRFRASPSRRCPCWPEASSGPAPWAPWRRSRWPPACWRSR